MTQTSQQFRVAREKNAPRISFQGQTPLKFAAALVFACALALAPAPTFAQHGGGVHRPGDGVQHAAIGCAEIGGDVAALFLLADDAEGADLLKRGDKILVEVGPDFWIG